MYLYIAKIFYPVQTLGPGNRVGIWLSGCPFRCEGCMSQELQDIKYGNKLEVDSIIKFVSSIKKRIDGITISGGEPFFQAEGLNELLMKLNERFLDIIVFTGYKYRYLNTSTNYSVKNALKYISVIIDGRFDKYNISKKGLKGSENQTIYILKDIYRNIDFNNIEKRIQIIFFDNKVLEIGIPGG